MTGRRTMRSASGSIAVWTNKTVLVTGGTGFIGSHLVDALLTRGASVLAFTRRPDAHRDGIDGRLRWIEGDVTRGSRVWQSTERTVVDIVFHLAALTDLAACRDDR